MRDPETGEEAGTYKKLVARSSTVNEVVRAIPACGAIVDGEMPQWLDGRQHPQPKDVVAFRNGLLDTAAFCRGDVTQLECFGRGKGEGQPSLAATAHVPDDPLLASHGR